MPGGEVLRIGPFTGGLNLASDVTTVADSELIECVNMELDIDGSLRSRPPIQLHYSESTNEFGTDRLLIIGSAVFSGTGYIFGSNAGGTYRSTNGSTWTLLQTTTECKVCIQYRGFVWFVATPGSTSGGFKWDPSGGVVAVAALPRGIGAVIHKERMYAVPGPSGTNASRLRFSNPSDLATWDAGNFIDVSPDDGTSLNEVIVYADNLMLFKDNSIFVLAYDLQPSEAILREVNPVIGVRLPYCVVQFENVAYMLHRDKVYEIVNYDFAILNAKVPFVLDTTVDPGGARTEEVSLSLLGERLVVRYYNKTYVFGIRTRTWSEWKKTVAGTPYWHNLGPLVKMPNTTTQSSTGDEYFASYTFNTVVGKIYKIVDGWTASGDEGELTTDSITCTISTKDFDMADPVHFKRLFWWGADVLTGDTVVGSLEPIVITLGEQWDEDTSNWNADSETWGSGTGAPPITQTTIIADGVYSISKSVKFLKSIRFRKVNFALQLQTKGTSLDGPAKVFSLVAVVATKQTVGKSVN